MDSNPGPENFDRIIYFSDYEFFFGSVSQFDKKSGAQSAGPQVIVPLYPPDTLNIPQITAPCPSPSNHVECVRPEREKLPTEK
jgi:hypothetical protein